MPVLLVCWGGGESASWKVTHIPEWPTCAAMKLEFRQMSPKMCSLVCVGLLLDNSIKTKTANQTAKFADPCSELDSLAWSGQKPDPQTNLSFFHPKQANITCSGRFETGTPHPNFTRCEATPERVWGERMVGVVSTSYANTLPQCQPMLWPVLECVALMKWKRGSICAWAREQGAGALHPSNLDIEFITEPYVPLQNMQVLKHLRQTSQDPTCRSEQEYIKGLRPLQGHHKMHKMNDSELTHHYHFQNIPIHWTDSGAAMWCACTVATGCVCNSPSTK